MRVWVVVLDPVVDLWSVEVAWSKDCLTISISITSESFTKVSDVSVGSCSTLSFLGETTVIVSEEINVKLLSLLGKLVESFFFVGSLGWWSSWHVS